MVKCKQPSLGWVFVSRMIGIICFLIIVVLARILTTFLPPETLVVGVINGILFANFWLLLVIALVLFAADIFDAFPFPLNLPAPIIRAFGSIFCIAFFISVLEWLDRTFGTTLVAIFWFPMLILIPLLFLIVIASGYYEILRKLWWSPKPEPDPDAQVVYDTSSIPPKEPGRDAKSWEEIGAECRLVLYDLLHRFREEIRGK
jgi:hypothetical protein